MRLADASWMWIQANRHRMYWPWNASAGLSQSRHLSRLSCPICYRMPRQLYSQSCCCLGHFGTHSCPWYLRQTKGQSPSSLQIRKSPPIHPRYPSCTTTANQPMPGQILGLPLRTAGHNTMSRGGDNVYTISHSVWGWGSSNFHHTWEFWEFFLQQQEKGFLKTLLNSKLCRQSSSIISAQGKLQRWGFVLKCLHLLAFFTL